MRRRCGLFDGNDSGGDGDQQRLPAGHGSDTAEGHGLKCGGPGPEQLDGRGKTKRSLVRTTWAPEGSPQDEEGSSASIRVITYNANCWKTFLKCVRQCKADVNVGQEVGLSTQDDVAKAQDTMGALGWSMLVVEAEQRN